MAVNHIQQTNTHKGTEEKDILSQIRRHRIIQICTVTAIGLCIALLVARGITTFIFAVGLVGLLVSLGFAYRYKVQLSAVILLGSLSTMSFALALTGAGLFDLAIIGYPGILIFAALLGGVVLFVSVIGFVIAQCTLIGWLTLQGYVTPNTPSLSWEHLIFILIIFLIISFGVYILVRDIKRLMFSLHSENQKVQKSRAQIQHLAHHDTLTNLPNRLFGEALFLQSLKTCEQNHEKLALLFIDLDNFKPINDALGHAAGDQLLEQLTQRLNGVLRNDQYLIRFGGDEFLVLSPYQDSTEQLNTMADDLIKQCASSFEILQTQVVVSASIGIACVPHDGKDFKQLCRKADIAMYQAKKDGKNTYHYYDKNLDKASEDKFKLLQLLRPAINQKQFKLYYQPMISLADEKITTVEALLRWPQPDGGFITPDQFIPLAESTGLISELGRWVIQQACLFCARHRSLGHSRLRVAVNLSVMQFKDGQLQHIVEKALHEAQIPADALELELTESLLIDETEQIQKQLNSLSDLGVTIAIDDFGTGYSNLGYLRNFNASKLKIDRSFIIGLGTAVDDEPLVEAIINMAKSLGLETVAEGIENKATLHKLLSMGCSVGQGYYWSKPVPEEELGALLNKSNSSI
ncbi:EAL domain-containing protein [Paraglaciecola aquimarina]|uniref:EAL domain-containing protein n=1 Tax=Paraglaciecola algarum TaxID=3050085 RepID=A0ABS9D9F8_9ALTE|nr:EAL domain-containing protein [Paraglaciecola sp. G1-23]MCF2949558.1 EAL domain-containing protein [Paraglaciecola sp. G1-23]